MTPRRSLEHDSNVVIPLLAALVVEPVPSLAKLLTGLMKQVGFRVLVATSPDDALNEIDNGCSPIDIVLCECSLPYFSGPRLASFIQQQRPAMPIVLLRRTGPGGHCSPVQSRFPSETIYARPAFGSTESCRRSNC